MGCQPGQARATGYIGKGWANFRTAVSAAGQRTGEMLLGIVQQGEDVVAFQFLAGIQEVEFHHKAHSGDLRAQ
jgi:hypothetical protein